MASINSRDEIVLIDANGNIGGGFKRGRINEMTSLINALRRARRAGRFVTQAMASPPSRLLGTAGAASLVNGKANGNVTHAWDSGFFRAVGMPVVISGVGFPDNTMGTAPATAITSSISNAACPTWEWAMDAADFDIVQKGTGSNFQLWIDDAPFALDPTAGPPLTGSIYHDRFQPGTTQMRRYRLEGGPNFRFAGINVKSTDVVVAVNASPLPRILEVGDSTTEGAGAATATGPGAPIYEIARILGFEPIMSGVGATGYNNNGGGGGKVVIGSRLQNDVISLAPEVVILRAGINDHAGFTTAQVAAAAGACMDQLISGLPNSIIVVAGILAPGTPLTATIATAESAIGLEASKRGLIWIPVSGLFTGSRNPLATTFRARTTNVATLTTASAHNYAVGNVVTVASVGGTGYNGVVTVTGIPTGTTFTFASTGTDEGTTADGAGLLSRGTAIGRISSDLIHMTYEGYRYVARHVAGALQQVLEL
jgi:lysophospholipase L1-like esterase